MPTLQLKEFSSYDPKIRPNNCYKSSDNELRAFKSPDATKMSIYIAKPIS